MADYAIGVKTHLGTSNNDKISFAREVSNYNLSKFDLQRLASYRERCKQNGNRALFEALGVAVDACKNRNNEKNDSLNLLG